jgi:flagellar motor switch protein FliM
MESNWTRAEFKNHSKLKGVGAEALRATHEVLARELALNISAFLRTSVGVTLGDVEHASFGDIAQEERSSCYASVLTRPGDKRLLLELEYSALFPLICIALGAKASGLAAPPRKPTDIELQVVNILIRLVLSEVYRAWAPFTSAPLETVDMRVERSAGRVFAFTDSVQVTQFKVNIGEHTGKLIVVAPQTLFQSPAAEVVPPPAEASVSTDAILRRMMPAKVSVDVWLEGSQMRLSDLLQLQAGQIIKLDHPVDRRAACTLNGKPTFTGQIVSTGAHRAFLVEDSPAAQ